MSEIYIQLECAIGLDNHFYKEPIQLFPCGHSICKECVPKDPNLVVKCKICGGVNDKDLRNQIENDFPKKVLEFQLKDLFYPQIILLYLLDSNRL